MAGTVCLSTALSFVLFSFALLVLTILTEKFFLITFGSDNVAFRCDDLRFFLDSSTLLSAIGTLLRLMIFIHNFFLFTILIFTNFNSTDKNLKILLNFFLRKKSIGDPNLVDFWLFVNQSECFFVLLLKCWDTSHCPKTSHRSVGTLHPVPRPTTQVLGYLALSQDISVLSQDFSRTVPRLPRTVPRLFRTVPKLLCTVSRLFRTVPRLLRTVPRLFRTVPRLFPTVPRLFGSVPRLFGAVPRLLRTVPRLFGAVPRLFGAVSKLLRTVPRLFGTVPRPCQSSVGPPHTVPRLLLSLCWDNRISSSSLLGLLNHYPWYHHLRSSIKVYPKPNLTNQKFQLLTPLYLSPFINLMQVETQLVRRCLVITCLFKTGKTGTENVKT